MSAAEQIDWEMSQEERVAFLYRAGHLRFKVLEHRLAHYDKFRAWTKQRQTDAYSRWCAEIGAQYGRVYMDESARKTAKTGTSLIMAVEECVQFAALKGYGARGMIAIPQKTKIGGVVVPICKEIFRDAPFGYAPEYRGSGDGEHEHLYIPAVEARIKLVGLDKNKEALRGPYLDFCIITEAGFVIGLEDVYVSEIKDQFQGRPWAWCLMESSTPKVIDHDFNVEFKPDCQMRDAYTSMVITDNTRLTQQEIEDEIRESGGMESAKCLRELFNIVKPDEEQMVIPEFNEAVHVVRPQDWPRPMYALAYEGIDPGTSDPLGYVAFYLDFDRQTIVVEKSFMRPNMSTGEFVSEVVKPTEHELWGTELESVERRDEARRELRMVQMQRIANANVLPDGTVWEAPPGSLTYWDATSWSLRPNPIARISDTHARFILDLNRDYGLSVREAEKEPGSAEADIEYLRELFRARHAHNGMPKIVILDNGKTTQLIQQLRSGMWKLRDDVHKVDWTRSKLLGHLDCLAALKYAVRDVRWTRNPKPPAVVDVHRNNLHVPKELMPPGVRSQAVPIGTNSGPRMSVGARLGIQPKGARPRFR